MPLSLAIAVPVYAVGLFAWAAQLRYYTVKDSGPFFLGLIAIVAGSVIAGIGA